MVSLMMFVTRMPFWIVGWLGGVLADRMDKRRLLGATGFSGGGVALLIAGLYYFDQLTLVILMILAFLFSVTRCLEVPTVGALLPQLKTPSNLNELNTLLDSTKRVGRLAAPILSSALPLLAAGPSLFGFVAAFLVASGLCSRSLQLIESKRYSGSSTSYRSDMKSGWNIVKKDRVLFWSIVCFALYNPVYSLGYWILLPRYFGSDLGGGNSLYSLAVAFFGAGALLCNLVLRVLKVKIKQYFVFVGITVVGVGLSFLAITSSIPMAFASVMVAAIGIPLMDIGMSHYINNQVAHTHQGRVFAIFRYFAEFGIAVGLLIGGVVADAFGARASYAIGGLYVVFIVSLYHVIQRGLKHEVSPKEYQIK